jgi:hypothetical protein
MSILWGMKLTNKNITAYVRQQLATNPVWAVKALVRIFQENQTEQEQAAEATTVDNGIGFTGTDGNFLSSLAKQQLARGKLSDKQMVFVFKAMPKYHKQVIQMSNPEQLKKLVEAAGEIA